MATLSVFYETASRLFDKTHTLKNRHWYHRTIGHSFLFLNGSLLPYPLLFTGISGMSTTFRSKAWPSSKMGGKQTHKFRANRNFLLTMADLHHSKLKTKSPSTSILILIIVYVIVWRWINLPFSGIEHREKDMKHGVFASITFWPFNENRSRPFDTILPDCCLVYYLLLIVFWWLFASLSIRYHLAPYSMWCNCCLVIMYTLFTESSLKQDGPTL